MQRKKILEQMEGILDESEQDYDSLRIDPKSQKEIWSM